MATNFIKTGAGYTMTITAAAAFSSGDGVKIGDRLGVAHDDVANGAQLVCHMDGVAVLPKDPTDTWSAGDDLYWDLGNSRLTNTAAGNSPAGQADDDRTGSDSFGAVNLNVTSTPGA